MSSRGMRLGNYHEYLDGIEVVMCAENHLVQETPMFLEACSDAFDEVGGRKNREFGFGTITSQYEDLDNEVSF
jgi:hypothetical protein